MKVKRIEHVAIAVKSLAKAREIFEDKLGLTFEYEEWLPQYQTKLAMFPVGESYLELLETKRADSETAKWIAEHGEGLFHICLEVDDIVAALAELKAKGVKLIDAEPRLGHANSRIAFLDPSSTNDVLIELVELPPEAGKAPGAARDQLAP
ncbi:MAG TPA: methylmalonyl-CoA epimerase [Hyphomicrobiaceae bacterium]|jgi:methylmalonyl-CoA/ethylmalonyl-CoA epimerase|nr:methylmalonyl-CoA epimerase [Hyphomicrobiaceae bacterium]